MGIWTKKSYKKESDELFFRPSHTANCKCEDCLRNLAFSIPIHLAEDFVAGKVVLFAGAGISTENKNIGPNRIIDEVAHALKNKNKAATFAELSEKFCQRPNGRINLIKLIKDRFDYIKSFDELYVDATRFHDELATYFPLDTIVTTNWDTYFEDHCAAAPFVQDSDIALWDSAKRKVLKIHGTISNFGSIVATTSDYKQCKRRLDKGLLGSLLKTLLSTKTVVFIGYSLEDDDFMQIFNFVKRQLRHFNKAAYFVSPFVNKAQESRLKAIDLKIIKTDGTFFISCLKSYAGDNRCIIQDTMYENISSLLDKVIAAHTWLYDECDHFKHPQILISAFYQDGMLHACCRILRMRATGEYSDMHRVQVAFQSYSRFAKGFQRDRRYDDAAYCEGYANVLLFALMQQDEKNIIPPLFFYFGGFESSSKSVFKRNIRIMKTAHVAAYKFCARIMSRYKPSDGIVIHHKPQLNVSKYISASA